MKTAALKTVAVKSTVVISRQIQDDDRFCAHSEDDFVIRRGVLCCTACEAAKAETKA